MGYLRKAQKEFSEDDLLEVYDWLADASHPSAGSGTAFVATQGRHNRAGAIMRTVISRRPPESAWYERSIRQEVPLAVVNALEISARLLARSLPRPRWLVEDIGLTSGVAWHVKDPSRMAAPMPPSTGCMTKPERNDPCPCGSGKRFKKCQHERGLDAVPPFPSQGEGNDP